MSAILDKNKAHILNVWARVAGLTALIFASIVLVGWLFQLPPLVLTLAGRATTKANACLGIGFCGLSLFLLARNDNSKRASLLALFAGTIGILTLIEWHAHCSLGIDQLLCHDFCYQEAVTPGRLGPRVPGRMGPNTSQCLVLLSIALITVQTLRWRLLANFAAAAVMLTSLLSTVSNFYSVPRVYSIQSFTEMAPLTSILLFFLSFGILCVQPQYGLFALLASDTTGGVAARRFLPACILAPIIVGWVDLQGQASGLYPQQFTVALLVICMVIFLVLLIWWVSHKMADEDQARAMAQEQQQAVERAQAESRFKSEFLASMSHEVRTPLNGILGMTEILINSGLPEKQLGFAKIISEAGRALLAVINDILDFSKIEAGKLVLETTDFDPVQLIEDVADLLTPQATDKNLSLLTFIDPKIPRSLVSDVGRLRQIILNLASNAIKFSESGEILIRASLEELKKDNATIKFSVTDSGVGMSDEETAKLFQPFVQLSGSIGRAGGTGLGLSISKRLIELLGGTIGLHSVKGHGSTFWVKLTMPLGKPLDTNTWPEDDLNGIKVLIVDDEKAAREILQDYLKSWGMEADTTSSAEDALKLMRSQPDDCPYKIAVVDLVMPGTTGLQLAKTIREDSQLSNTRLILVTAFDKPGQGEEANMLGLNAYLTKPIKQKQLSQCIKTVLNEKSLIKKKEPNDDIASERKVETMAKRSELILVADDNMINEQVALLQLKILGFESQVARDGERALEMVENNNFDLILMDCQMPVMDGFEATRAIRVLEEKKGKRVPIIAMTAHVMEGSREQCLDAGMDDYISKPVALEQLRTVLERWLPAGQADGANAGEGTDLVYIDIKKLEENYGAEADVVRKVFIDNIGPQREAFRVALKNHLLPELGKCVHALRGSAGAIFSDAVVAACLKLEANISEGKWTQIEILSEELEKKLDRALMLAKKD